MNGRFPLTIHHCQLAIDHSKTLMTNPIPRYDFGGSGDLIHFAHANAYPPGSYRLFIDALTPNYQVAGIVQRPLWPTSSPDDLTTWQLFAADLIRFMEQEGLRGVVGMGHSLGAVATMLAAVQRPDLFRALVLIEPVFLPPHVLEMAAANPGASEHLPLVQSARRRRNRWPSRQAAFDRFRTKSVFSRFSDEALWDYVNSGVRDDADSGDVVLAFRRDWEAQIYALPPTMVWEEIPRITQPTLGIRGADSDTIMPASWQLWQEKQPADTFVAMPDTGHMVPMERPSALANTIHNFLQTID